MTEVKYKIARDHIFEPLRFGKMLVYQAGRMHCGAGSVIPEHTQLSYYELTVATGGKGINITDGVSVPICAGDIHVSFAGDFHSIVSDEKDPLKYDFLTVGTEDEALSRALEEIVERHHDAGMRIVRDEFLSMLVSHTVSEMNMGGEYSGRIVEIAVEQIIILLIRALKRHSYAAVRKNVTEADLVCLKVMNYIDNHIYSLKNLSELCNVVNYNYNYLSNLFKKTTSGTLRDYLSGRKLETARLLIGTDGFSVTKTAELLGYSSVYSFVTAFKKRYGMSPRTAAGRKGETE